MKTLQILYTAGIQQMRRLYKSVWELLKCNHPQRQLRESSSTFTAVCSYSHDNMIGTQLSTVWAHNRKCEINHLCICVREWDSYAKYTEHINANLQGEIKIIKKIDNIFTIISVKPGFLLSWSKLINCNYHWKIKAHCRENWLIRFICWIIHHYI